MQQDSTDPTGVRGETSGEKAGGRKVNGNSVSAARSRKAAAAIELSLGGADWGEIARILGYPTARLAKVATERTLAKQLTDTDREKLRALASKRLDRLLRAVWSKAIDPEAPEQLAAAGRARELIADHRRLWGLDAPSEVVVTSPSQAELDAWVARVVSQQVPDVPEYDIIEGEIVGDSHSISA